MNVAPNLAATLVAGRPLALTGVADGAQGLVIADLARTLAARRRIAVTKGHVRYCLQFS